MKSKRLCSLNVALLVESRNKNQLKHIFMQNKIISILFLLLVVINANAQKKVDTNTSIEQQGMVDIHSLDKTIRVSLMYSRSNNFTGEVLYTDLTKAYLHPLAAHALVKAQAKLKELRPDLSLIIFDATRPMSIQQKMWDKVKNTSKDIYVSNPANGGGLHNYGLAVDISICKLNGDTITMGTKVDHMSLASHVDNENNLVTKRIITKEAQQNRELLRLVMQYAGFKPLRTEWWHFNFRSRAQAKQFFKVVK